MTAISTNKILIVHRNNSHHAQNIARIIRSLHVYCEIVSIHSLEKKMTCPDNYPSGLILISDHKDDLSLINPLNRPCLNTSAHSELDEAMQRNIADFIFSHCQCLPSWTSSAIIKDHIQKIKQSVGQDEVILALSGGVDSSVVAALLHQAIGNQLTCIFVDTGLMRMNEGDYVMEIFARNMGVNVLRINAETRFLSALENISDPEQKRKIIGKLFIDIFEEEAGKLNNATWLAQGTIYPDILESESAGDGTTVAVKSHHNVGGLPEQMNLKLIEPLADLFKDEVRKLGVALGLPSEMVYRHPFPGPGLGVRILGKITKEYADILRQADQIFIDELRKAGWYDKVAQAFAIFLPVKSVGLHEGQRVYEYVISLRAIETIDFVHAHAAHLPYDLTEHIVNRIITEIPEVSRVVYDISNKPPATIEWE